MHNIYISKIIMKKFLFWILAFLWIWLSFCSADWIYWNETWWLISIVYNNWVNVLTLQDKNLWANCTDTSSYCSYWNYYQWWNNFAFTTNPTYNFTTSTSNPWNLDDYWPWNYFNSNGVLYGDLDSNNYNLWGWVTATNEAMQWPCPSWFHVVDNWENVSTIFQSMWFDSYSSTPYTTYLKMPLAWIIWWLYWDPEFWTWVDIWNYWNYWGSNSYSSLKWYRIVFNDSSNLQSYNEVKVHGFSVRCFKNEAVSPEYTRTKLYWDTISQPITIDVFYDYDNSHQTIICNWDNSIHINSLSNYNNWVFTPYFNIFYSDQDNQVLTESYSKQLLILNWKYNKTYTWWNDNYWVLTPEGVSESVFSWYLPVFDVTWGINDVSTSWNIFNNFAENSLKFTLSNIPSYIQYVILLFVLFFILGFIRKFRRK